MNLLGQCFCSVKFDIHQMEKKTMKVLYVANMETCP